MSVCKNCGYESDDDSSVCEVCGVPVKSHLLDAVAKKRIRTSVIVIVCIIAAFSVTVVLALFAREGDKGGSESDNDFIIPEPTETIPEETTAVETIPAETGPEFPAGDHPYERLWDGEGNNVSLSLYISEYNEETLSFSGSITLCYKDTGVSTSKDIYGEIDGGMYYFKIDFDTETSWMSLSIASESVINCEMTVQGTTEYIALNPIE